MVCTQVLPSRGAVTLLCLAGAGLIIAAPTPSSTGLAVREAAPVAEYFDQADLIKRVNLGLFSLILTTFGKFYFPRRLIASPDVRIVL